MSRITTEEGLEIAFAKLILEWQRKKIPVYQFKVVGGRYQEPGVSDRLVCYYGLFIAIELKKPGRITRPDGSKKPFKPSSDTEALQVVFIDNVRRSKGYGDFFDNLQDVVNYFDMIHEKECLN